MTTYDGNGGRAVTTIAPDGAQSVQSYLGDRLISSVSSVGAVQLARSGFGYDGHGRRESATDARSGTVWTTYYDDDLVKTVMTPDPDLTQSGPGFDPQTTQYTYDIMGRQMTVTLADGGVVNYRYWPTGQ